MRKSNGIIINGEYLGNSVVINGMFRAICAISPAIMRNFVQVLNKLDTLDEAVKINNFHCGHDKIDIEFVNKNSHGSANLSFVLRDGEPILTDTRLKINDEEYVCKNGELIKQNVVSKPKSLSSDNQKNNTIQDIKEEETAEIKNLHEEPTSECLSDDFKLRTKIASIGKHPLISQDDNNKHPSDSQRKLSKEELYQRQLAMKNKRNAPKNSLLEKQNNESFSAENSNLQSDDFLFDDSDNIYTDEEMFDEMDFADNQKSDADFYDDFFVDDDYNKTEEFISETKGFDSSLAKSAASSNISDNFSDDNYNAADDDNITDGMIDESSDDSEHEIKKEFDEAVNDENSYALDDEEQNYSDENSSGDSYSDFINDEEINDYTEDEFVAPKFKPKHKIQKNKLKKNTNTNTNNSSDNFDFDDYDSEDDDFYSAALKSSDGKGYTIIAKSIRLEIAGAQNLPQEFQNVAANNSGCMQFNNDLAQLPLKQNNEFSQTPIQQNQPWNQQNNVPEVLQGNQNFEFQQSQSQNKPWNSQPGNTSAQIQENQNVEFSQTPIQNQSWVPQNNSMVSPPENMNIGTQQSMQQNQPWNTQYNIGQGTSYENQNAGLVQTPPQNQPPYIPNPYPYQAYPYPAPAPNTRDGQNSTQNTEQQVSQYPYPPSPYPYPVYPYPVTAPYPNGGSYPAPGAEQQLPQYPYPPSPYPFMPFPYPYQGPYPSNQTPFGSENSKSLGDESELKKEEIMPDETSTVDTSMMTLDEFLEQQKKLQEALEDKRRKKFRIVGSKESIRASALKEGVYVAGKKVFKWGAPRQLDG